MSFTFVALGMCVTSPRWLGKNTERVCLSQGETFYDQAKLPKRKLHNCFSFFAATLKKCRS